MAPPVPPTSVVVVGAGLAGAGTVAALRSSGWTGRLTVIGAEDLPPYDRPPLSKELLSRPEPARLADELALDLAVADDVWLDRRATGLRLGGTGSDAGPGGGGGGDARDGGAGPGAGVTVVTDAGEVTADAVVVATGAHAIRPWPDALTLHTAADAERLRARLRPGARLVVVGAGWIGAEVAGVAVAAGVDVTVVEAAVAPLAGALGPEVGAWTAPWYAAAGVRLVTGRTVTSVAAGEVALDDGEVLAADVVLAAVGVRPATAWLSGALPLAQDGSIEVDDAFRAVGVEARVVALGDVARRRSVRHGWVPGGHWDGALKAPSVAVRRLLGGEPVPADDVAPYVFSTQLGHELALHGLPGVGDDVVVRGDTDGAFAALWFRPGTDTLTAVFTVDRPHDVAAARRLFTAEHLPRLDRTRAADPTTRLRDALHP